MNMRELLAAGSVPQADLVLLGVPISRASISPSQAWSTPPAFREALQRFPSWDAATATALDTIRIADAGDVEGDRGDPDAVAAHRRLQAAVRDLAERGAAVVALAGGDNSLTRPAMLGMMAGRRAEWGLLTLDAHHDCRDPANGSRNGTPVRELIEAGLDGQRVVQVGIHPFGNAREHAAWAAEHGVHVHGLEEVSARGMAAVIVNSLSELRGAGVTDLYVDLDVDVVNRADAPACPASLPGGLPPTDLLSAARLLGAEPMVAAVDLCEVDAMADVAGITVRLMAATFTALVAGLAQRGHAPGGR